MPASSRPTLIFDLGGVLVDWNPRYLYGKLFKGDDAAMERFLLEVCSPEWNLALDAGGTFEDGIAELVARHPEQRHLIEVYWTRWLEMLRGPIHGTVGIVERLAKERVPLFALSNWSRETFALVRELPEYAFLARFERIFLSAEMGLVKPDPRIFQVMLEDLGRAPDECLFIDDSLKNVLVARELGIGTHHYVAPEALGDELRGLGFRV
ncbi:MAG TPA: HAD family phosphatase [Geminicoccaceae bacterium]|nr:HAD family phosphatase [Geminicoccaceae bacterium]